MQLDHYRTLGRSGLRISPICLGTMTFGQDWGWGSDESEARSVFETYLERGGNYFDTANFYTGGSSETLLGRFAQGRRDRLVIATKFSLCTDPGDPNAGGNHRKNLRRPVEARLRRPDAGGLRRGPAFRQNAAPPAAIRPPSANRSSPPRQFYGGPVGASATIDRKSRQGRKAATVSVDSGAGVTLAGPPPFCGSETPRGEDARAGPLLHTKQKADASAYRQQLREAPLPLAGAGLG